MSDFIPEGWHRQNLGSVAQITMGQSPLSETYNFDRIGLPFFQGKTDFGAKYPVTRVWCNQPSKIAEKGAILFSVRAPVGDVNIAKEKCCIGRGLSAIKGMSVDQLFLYQKIQFVNHKFQLLAQGSTFEAVNGNEVKDFFLTLPPLPEQQKIAAILTAVDEVIASTQAQISKLKDLKTAMMQELLTKGIGHTEFKDSPVGRIPKTWDRLPLSSVSTLITKGATPTTSGHAYADSGVRFYRSVNATKDGILDKTDIKFVTIDGDASQKRSRLALGDVAISIVGAQTGRTYFCITENSELPANINQNIALIRPARNKLDPKFLKYTIASKDFQYQVDMEITTQAQPCLSLAQVGNFSINIPTTEEQAKIAMKLDSISIVIQKKNEKLKTFNNTKKALMQDLLTGKVRVRVN